MSLFFLVLFSIVLVVCVKAQSYSKVTVELYYEALCPGCQSFITGSLARFMEKSDLVAITDLKMVPYGNTKQSADGVFTCQHGVDECTSDVIELCTMYKLAGNITAIADGSASAAAWPFLLCMEKNEGNPSLAESCFSENMKSSGLDWTTVDTCTKDEASYVQSAAAATTPSHDYVPWPLVNGVVLANTNLLEKTVCDAYTGPKPSSCKVAAQEKVTGLCINA